MTKLSKISFFLFITIYNYLWFRILLFNYFYNRLDSMAMFWLLVMIVAVIGIILLIPKKLLKKDYFSSFKKSYFKYLYAIIVILEVGFGVCFCCYLMTKIFIQEANPLVVIGIISFVVAFLSQCKPCEVIEISTLFSIFWYILLIISSFLFPEIDFTTLLPFKNVDVSLLPFLIIIIIADNLAILIDKENTPFSKFSYTIAILVSLLLLAVDYLSLVCSSGTEFFKGLNWVGFISLSIQPVNMYFINFEFAYIYIILISCVFKYAYKLSIIRGSLKLKPKAMTLATMLIMSGLSILCYKTISFNNFALFVTATILLFSFVIFFWFVKECYFVRKSKE